MKLVTQIPMYKAKNPMDYTSQLVLLGSCFVENMGKKLEYFKFRNIQNPFGILYHPKAIEKLVERSVMQEHYTEEELFFHNGRWHCYDAHSRLSDTSRETVLKKLNQGLEETLQHIKGATHIIITLGTAWAYRHKDSLVANCHKVPQKEFVRELLSIDTIHKSLMHSFRQIKKVNQEVQFIFTISPVRHLRDGFVENQRSKAHLITAVQQVMESAFFVDNQGEAYFPSYELMMDELRDYRFYESDMIHPNTLAIDYIWEKFKEVWISENAYPTMLEVDAIQKGLRHRPFDKNSEQHRSFEKSLRQKISYILQEFPFMDFGQESQA